MKVFYKITEILSRTGLIINYFLIIISIESKDVNILFLDYNINYYSSYSIFIDSYCKGNDMCKNNEL